jgi:hypothetical protein
MLSVADHSYKVVWVTKYKVKNIGGKLAINQDFKELYGIYYTFPLLLDFTE